MLTYLEGGQPLPWTSARILCLIIIGGILIIAFVIWGMFNVQILQYRRLI